MRKALCVLYQPYKFLVFLPMLGIATLLASVLAIVLSSIISPRLGGVAGFFWARLLALLTPMCVSVRGREHMDKKQSYVIVSNHQSHFDILVLYGWLGRDIRWVMKKELRKVPALGIASVKLGHIFVDRSDSAAARAALQEAKQRITGGTSVLFFPEGTRSLTGELGEFKKGAFAMALDLGLPLLPITINGTGKVLPPTSLNLFPGRASMTIHEPIAIAGYSRENMDALMERVKSVIRAGLE